MIDDSERDWRPPFPNLARTLGLTEADSLHKQLDLLIHAAELDARTALTDEDRQKYERRLRVLTDDRRRLEVEVPLALERKLEGIIIEAAQLDAEIAHTDDMIERLQAHKHRLKQERERSIEWRLARLLPMVEQDRKGKRRYRSPLGTIYYRNKQPAFEVQGDELNLPARFLKQPPPKADLGAMREAYRAGEKLPSCVIVRQPPAVPAIRITKRVEDPEETEEN